MFDLVNSCLLCLIDRFIKFKKFPNNDEYIGFCYSGSTRILSTKKFPEFHIDPFTLGPCAGHAQFFVMSYPGKIPQSANFTTKSLNISLWQHSVCGTFYSTFYVFSCSICARKFY